MKTIRIATRGSQLALWQAHHVGDLLAKLNPSIEIKYNIITTSGDRIQDKALYEVGGKGLFLKEIEEALLADEADLAVHSLKDVPFSLPEGLELAAILPRQDARDALVSKNNQAFTSLKPGAKVGTSSLRRRYQLEQLRPDLVYVPLRGNVDTRLKKCRDGDYEAIILAAAGLKRLGLDAEIADYLPTIPAVGQGAIAIEVRKEATELIELFKSFHCQETALCVTAEREYLKVIQGGCDIPVACHVVHQQGLTYNLRAYLAQHDGSRPRYLEKSGPATALNHLAVLAAQSLLS